MRYAGSVLLVACGLIVACSGRDLSVRGQFLAQSNVSVQLETWIRAINNQDRDSVAAVYHQVPELRILNIDGTVSRGWEEERDRQSQFFDDFEIVNFVVDGIEIEVVNDALVLTIFRQTLDAERNTGQRDATVSGLGTIVWIKDTVDDVWKIHTLHMSARQRVSM